MWLCVFRRPKRKVRPAAPVSHFRPSVECLEQREVLASPGSMHAPALGAALVSSVTPTVQQIDAILPLKVTGVTFSSATGQLLANIQLGNLTTTAPLTLSATPNPNDASCPILNLHLGPIHLDLLGLNVDTSEICLSITAHQGGGLLGDLLCGVSNALNGGTPLGGILGGLSTTDLSTVTSGLTGILNGALGAIKASPNATVGGHSGGACDILDLSLGPVDLTLLGLNVHLDNCNNGPVTIDVTAQPGPGNLLGNLLCGLTHVLDSNANLGALARRLDRLGHVIGDALGGLV
jgi:hypothetical protein